MFRQGGYRDVGLSVLQFADGHRRIAGLQVDEDLRVGSAETGKDVREDAENGGDRAVKGNFAGRGAVAGQIGLQPVPALDGLLGVIPEGDAGRGEAHRTAVAGQQLATHFGLQLLDGPGESGRRDIAGLAGPAEMEGAGQVPENL